MKQHNFLTGKIDKCQICGSNNLIQVIDLGHQPLANTLQKNTPKVMIKQFPNLYFPLILEDRKKRISLSMI